MHPIDVERAALVALLHPPRPFRWAPLRDVVAEGIVAPSEILADSSGKGLFGSFEEEIELAYSRIQTWQQDGTRFLTYLDPEYPLQLRDAHDLPPFIFARGLLFTAGKRERGVSIVGSRKVSIEAAQIAAEISARLITSDISVVSGLAAGIDSIAHSTALERGGRTVGVVGTGIDQYYPKSSAPLQQRMERGEGLVISQFWPGSSPTRASFPMRNVVMSAYSRATIIVEAAEKSGTRHQAHSAVRHGRPVILLSSVANGTTWGRTLSSDSKRFDVYVASNAEEAALLAAEVSKDLQVLAPSTLQGSDDW